MLILPAPDQEAIAKTRQFVFNRTGRTPTEEDAARIIGGLMRYFYLMRCLDEQLRAERSKPRSNVAPNTQPEKKEDLATNL